MSSSKRSIFPHFRRTLLLVSVLIVALVAATFAYLTSLPPSIGPRASIISDPVEFSIEMDKTDFEKDENVSVRVSLKNISNRTVTLKWGKYHSPEGQTICFDFHVLDVNNSLIYHFSQLHGALLSSKTIVLNASQLWVNYFRWYQEFDYPQDLVKVPAGVYSIVGLTNRVGLTIGNETRIVELETPSITIRIR